MCNKSIKAIEPVGCIVKKQLTIREKSLKGKENKYYDEKIIRSKTTIFNFEM